MPVSLCVPSKKTHTHVLLYDSDPASVAVKKLLKSQHKEKARMPALHLSWARP